MQIILVETTNIYTFNTLSKMAAKKQIYSKKARKKQHYQG